MAPRHVVVDGSNLATEGRSMPSLAQLDAAVREFLLENPDDMVTVVVDASFGHRIDPSEFKVFEEAEAAGEVVSPPAGAIGRGDAFLLRIADKTGATVLSNDSFQEFHGDYDWLFERGRLIGGKPVPGVGWIFTPRTPVRGPRSREAVKEAKRKSKTEAESAVPGLDLAASRTRGKGKKTVERAIAVATEEAVAPEKKTRRRRKGGTPPSEPVNDPLTFIRFIAAHPLGAEVTATVESFASHGAFVECEEARCYVPLSAMGDPPPKSAREIFAKGEAVRLIVQALDPHRRGVELALPGYAKIAGAPTEETVAAEIGSEDGEGAVGEVEAGASPDREAAAGAAPVPVRRTRKRAPAAAATGDAATTGEPVAAEAAVASATPAEPPAPKRRRPTSAAKVGPARTTAPEPTAPETTAAEATGAEATGAEVPERAPAASRRRRRATSVQDTAAAAAEAGAGETASADGPAGESAEEPAAPRRRRRKAAGTEPAPGPGPDTALTVAETGSGTSVVPAVAGVETVAAEAAEVVPAVSRRRRRPVPISPDAAAAQSKPVGEQAPVTRAKAAAAAKGAAARAAPVRATPPTPARGSRVSSRDRGEPASTLAGPADGAAPADQTGAPTAPNKAARARRSRPSSVPNGAEAPDAAGASSAAGGGAPGRSAGPASSDEAPAGTSPAPPTRRRAGTKRPAP